MDTRRLLTLTSSLAATGLLLSGCATGRSGEVLLPFGPVAEVLAIEPLAELAALAAPAEGSTAVPYLPVRATHPAADRAPATTPTGRAAIAAANQAARAPSRGDAFVGGVQVFAYAPGRVFEIWTAPLRVTTLTLGEGETMVSKAAGDTIRWQIGDTSSGAGANRRTHVLLKPLERGLETNLVLTTNLRVYLLNLKSGSADAFNAAVAWDAGFDAPMTPGSATPDPVAMDQVAEPQGPIDARYRIEPQGRRARWTPSSVFNDGRRTFITFDADLQIDEAPVLFVTAPDGEAQLVNYRQQGGMFVVDRLFDRAELRLGGRRPQVVLIRRLAGGRS